MSYNVQSMLDDVKNIFERSNLCTHPNISSYSALWRASRCFRSSLVWLVNVSWRNSEIHNVNLYHINSTNIGSIFITDILYRIINYKVKNFFENFFQAIIFLNPFIPKLFVYNLHKLLINTAFYFLYNF